MGCSGGKNTATINNKTIKTDNIIEPIKNGKIINNFIFDNPKEIIELDLKGNLRTFQILYLFVKIISLI